MSKPKPPPAPDPAQLVRAQTESNLATAEQNAKLNRVNEFTPYGGSVYSRNPDDTWNRTTFESGNQQALREGQEQQGIALGQLGLEQTEKVRGILSNPFSVRRFNSREATGGALDLNEQLGARPDLNLQPYQSNAMGSFEDDVTRRQFDLATTGMDRAFGRSEEALRSRLANQGITAGSEAFGGEMEAFNTGKGNAYAQALIGARGQAMAERGQRAGELAYDADLAQQQAGFGVQNRNMMMAELLTQRGTNLAEAEADYGRGYAADLAERQIPLSEITSIMGGTPIQPINPGGISTVNMAGADVMGAYQMQQQAQQNAYNQKMAGRNAIIGGLAGLGGAWLGRG